MTEKMPRNPREMKEMEAERVAAERREEATERAPESQARVQAAVDNRDRAVEERREARASLDVAEEKFAEAKSERDAAHDGHKRAVEAVQSAEADIFTRRRELDDDAREVKHGE